MNKKIIWILVSLLSFIFFILPSSITHAQEFSKIYSTLCGVGQDSDPCNVGYFNKKCEKTPACSINPLCDKRTGNDCCTTPIEDPRGGFGFQQCVNWPIEGFACIGTDLLGGKIKDSYKGFRCFTPAATPTPTPTP